MKTSTAILALCVGSLLASCAQKSISPTSFTPAYKTQLDSADVVIAQRCAGLSGVDIENGLASKVVGKRSLETKSAPEQNISMTGNVPDWVRASATEMFKRAQLKISDSQGPRLKLRLAEIAINENVYVKSGYDGRVILDAALINGQGQVCWTQRKSGTSSNYGNSGTAISYQETVDHALDRAIMSIVADQGFQNAACSACRN